MSLAQGRVKKFWARACLAHSHILKCRPRPCFDSQIEREGSESVKQKASKEEMFIIQTEVDKGQELRIEGSGSSPEVDRRLFSEEKFRQCTLFILQVEYGEKDSLFPRSYSARNNH